MELPDPYLVRNRFRKIVEKFDAFISFLSTNKTIAFLDYNSYLHSIRMEIIEIWNQINFLTITDRKYSKAFEHLRKILIKLIIDSNEVEKKHIKTNILSWEYKYQEGKMRKDLIKFFKNISKQMKKIEKNI